MRSYKTRAFGPVGALLWENWRLTYLAFIVALALGAGVTHSLAEMQRMQLKNAWGDPVLPSYAICYFALFMYGAIALHSLANPKALSMRIPSRHYSLPMRTGTMVAVQLAYRVASFSLLAAALFVLMRIEFGELVDRSIVSDMAISITIFSYVLAVAWSWGAVRPMVTAVLIVALPLLAIGVAIKASGPPSSRLHAVSPRPGLPNQPGMTFLGREDGGRLATSEVHTPRRAGRIVSATEGHRIEPEPSRRTWIARVWERLKVAGILGLYLLAAVYLAVAYVSGIRGRMGTVTSERSEGIATRIFGNGPKITSSAQQAQVWYEWRRKGLVLPGLTLCFTIAAMISAWIAEGTDLEITDLAEAFVLVPVYASVFAAFFTGLYMFSVDYRHATSGLSTFLYTRPLSTDAYTRARLRMSVQSVLLNIVLCLALGLAGLTMMGEYGQLPFATVFDDLEEAPIFVFMFVAYGLLLWSLLWMSVPVLVYLLWFGCYFYYQTLVNAEFEQINEHVHMFWLVWIPAVVLVGLTAAVWRHPTMWRSLSQATVARARNLMLLALIAMVACAWSDGVFESWRSDVFERLSIVAAILGLSMLPALSILTQPLVLDRLRRK